MKAADSYVKARPIRESDLIWSYGGDQYAPNRRISVNPNSMLIGTVYLSIGARGLLLSLFCRYWGRERPIDPEILREREVPEAEFEALVKELIDWKVAKWAGKGLVPGSAFGRDPDEGSAEAQRRNDRGLPSDWLEIRDAVFTRDYFACVYCGSGSDLHCDHVIPVVLGGSHEIVNLVTACAACNLSKGPKTLAEWRPDLAAKLAK
jgi:hypothetical protein